MRIVCVSDTHGLHERVEVPEGDVLVHAGDMTGRGEEGAVAAFGAWLRDQPHPHEVVVAGNHDFLCERSGALARELSTGEGVHDLEDEGAEITERRFRGSPWQPRFRDWGFDLDRGPELAARWARIPRETDVLVTHGPPHGVLDRVARGGRAVGCEDLAARLGRLDVSLHVFGYIHEAAGSSVDGAGRVAVNASACTLALRPTNAPLVLDWPDRAHRPVVAASADPR